MNQFKNTLNYVKINKNTMFKYKIKIYEDKKFLM